MTGRIQGAPKSQLNRRRIPSEFPLANRDQLVHARKSTAIAAVVFVAVDGPAFVEVRANHRPERATPQKTLFRSRATCGSNNKIMTLETPSMDSLDVEGRRVLMRVDFNAPLGDGGEITDDTRLRAALPTINEVLERGGRPILMSHLGRPKGEVVPELRLNPIAVRLAELLGRPVQKLDDCVGAEVEQAVQAAAAGSVILLENVRFHAGETKGDPELSQAMARNGDVFINDAFGSSHRDHCSVSGVARLLPSAAGRLLQSEITAFGRVLNNPERPLVAALGGAKVSDKLLVIDNLLDVVDRLLVGGGMAYTFLRAQGIKVGGSLVQEDQLGVVEKALAKAEKKGVKLLLPSDHVVANAFSKDAEHKVVEGDIPDGWMALDLGPKSCRAYAEALADAGTVVWNGPMGVFEWEAFQTGTETLGRAAADCKGFVVVGGGDSVAAISKFKLADRIDHVSTGGGASLELLEGKVLPGISALSLTSS